MRTLKAILSLLLLMAAVVGGVFTVLLAVTVTLVGRAWHGLFGRPVAAAPSPRRPTPTDAIEVTATDISDR